MTDVRVDDVREGPPRLRTAFDRGIKRYEPVLIILCVITVIARYGPGAIDATVDGQLGAPFARPASPIAAPVAPTAQDTGGLVGPPAPTSSVDTPVESAPAPAVASSAPAVATDTTPAAAPVTTPAPAPVDDLSTFARLAADATPGGLVAVGAATYAGVASPVGSQVLRYQGAGEPARTYGLKQVTGKVSALEPAGDGLLYVLGATPAKLVALDLDSGEERAIASIPDVAPCLPVVVTTNCDASVVDRPPVASGMAVDEDGNVYVADSSQGAVWRIDKGKNTAFQFVVHADLAGPAGPSGGLGVQDVGVATGGHLVLSVAKVGDGAGAVFLQEITSQGVAGQRARVYEAAPDERVGPLAVSRSGHVYVGTAGAGQLVVIGPSGQVARRLPPAKGALGEPHGVAIAGRFVLVATQVPGSPAQNVIFQVASGEPA